MNREDCEIIDVRDEQKFSVGHIPNAISMPYNNFPVLIDKSKIKSNKTILIYCGSGNSSLKATKLLAQKEFESVMSIEGGFSEWVKLQLPVSQKNI